jgi:hypothetical protein
MQRKKRDAVEGMCPVLDLPCPGGVESSQECQARFMSDFDPMTSIRDFSVLECATVRAARMRGATIKYLY